MKDFFLNSGLESSYLRVLSEKCDAVNGINLSQGVCDDGTPAKVLDEATRSLIDGNNSYVSHFGIEKLIRLHQQYYCY